MNYTIKITRKGKEAEKIISQINELVGDSPYVGIYEDETDHTEEMEQEMDRRYQLVLNNTQEGKGREKVKEDWHGREFVFIPGSINTHSLGDCKGF